MLTDAARVEVLTKVAGARSMKELKRLAAEAAKGKMTITAEKSEKLKALLAKKPGAAAAASAAAGGAAGYAAGKGGKKEGKEELLERLKKKEAAPAGPRLRMRYSFDGASGGRMKRHMGLQDPNKNPKPKALAAPMDFSEAEVSKAMNAGLAAKRKRGMTPRMKGLAGALAGIRGMAKKPLPSQGPMYAKK
jgi:hypothetical protein